MPGSWIGAWDPVWDALAARFRVIRPDLRGFGETPASTEPFTNWRDLADLLRGLEAMPASVIGVSIGGSASLDLALAEPGLIDRLVLVALAFGEEVEASLTRHRRSQAADVQ